MVDPGQSQGSGYLCPAGPELRITRRCLEEDLGEDPEDCEFEAMCAKHEIVRALRNRRSSSVAGGDTVGPAAGPESIYTLRYGNDHRGGTWYDAENKVVWLLAAAHHRSGEPDDAFQRFGELREEGRIYPVADDLEDLAADRAVGFLERAKLAVPGLIAEAQASPGTEVSAVIGNEPLGCVIHLVETAEERFFAVSGYVGPTAILTLKVLFSSDSDYEDWRDEPRLPTRPLDHVRAELCFAVMIDAGEGG
jgi:hypothetical protein